MMPSQSQNRFISLSTRDDHRISATWFEPMGEAKATIVINGATAVPQSYYLRFAQHLAASSYRVLTYDYRGVGASRPPRLRGYRATMMDWALYDARAALDEARHERSELPLVLVGHSFGGQLLGLLDEAQAAKGAVLVGAQLGYYGHWPVTERLRLAFTWNVLVPTLTRTFGYLPGKAGLGEDLPRGVAEEWARWCSHPDYLVSEHPEARARFARFRRPTLFYSFTDDKYAPEGAVDALIDRLSGAELTHRRLDPRELAAESVGHFGFFRPRFADSLWREARWFIDDLVEDRKSFQPAPRRSRFAVSSDEVMADLSYGRA
jgi:predicted alpha/beta hydrolase